MRATSLLHAAGTRNIVRLGRTALTYRGCLRWSVAAALAVTGLLVGGGVAGVLLSAAALVALAWTVSALRLMRLAPSCSGPGGGGPGPGDTGVREPRCPRPAPPGGAITLPLPEDPPDGAAALA